MRRKTAFLAATLSMAIASAAFAGEPSVPAVQTAQAGPGAGAGGQIYGSQLMTQQERLQYREQMGNAKTEQERQQLRLEHHQQMQQRARQKGVTLPDEPPADRGMGRGMGGGGMGGGGMGGGGMGGGGMGGGMGRGR